CMCIKASRTRAVKATSCSIVIWANLRSGPERVNPTRDLPGTFAVQEPVTGRLRWRMKEATPSEKKGDTMSQPPADREKVQKLASKAVGDLTAQYMGTLSTVADRLGLFRTLARVGPVTSEELAARAGIDERYGREWLSAMACHGYVSYEDSTKRFSMTPEQQF